ncbi:MAG: hypothetical protein GY796_30190, partial [Chloroflexi bacterium]|nr:hypothetical protein [Chloroflexota bacterium]
MINNIPYPTVEQWLTGLDHQGKSQLTIKSYRRGLAHFIQWSEQSYGQQ